MALTRGQILSQPVVQDNDGVTGGSITFRDLDLSNEITFKAPDDVTANYDITLPAAPPAVDGYILSFLTDGTASFVENTPTPGGTVEGAIQYRTSGGAQAGADFALYNPGNQSIDLVYNSTTPTPLRWLDTASSNFAAFQAPGDITRDYTVDLPALIPGTTGTTDAVGYVLKITSHSDQSVPGETTAALEWGPPITGDNQSQGPQFTVQLAGDAAGEFASSSDTPAYDNTNYLTYTYSTGDLNIVLSSGAYQINGVDVLDGTTLGGNVVNSSLTNLGTLTGLTIDNTITTPTDTDLVLSPAGAGDVVVAGNPGTAGGKIDIEDAQNPPDVLGIQAPADFISSHTITLPAANNSVVGNKVMFFDENYTGSYISAVRTINFCFDGGGVTNLSVGPKGFIRVDGQYNITKISLLTDSSDTMTVTVTRATFANYPTLSAFSPALTISTSGSTKAEVDVSANNLTISDGDILDFEITGGTTPFNSVFATVSLTITPISLS